MDVCLHIIRANIRNNWEWRHFHTLINEEISQNSRRPGNTWRAHGTRRLISWRRSGRGENTFQHPNQTREKLTCLSYCDAQGDKLGAGRGSSHGSGRGSTPDLAPVHRERLVGYSQSAAGSRNIRLCSVKLELDLGMIIIPGPGSLQAMA